MPPVNAIYSAILEWRRRRRRMQPESSCGLAVVPAMESGWLTIHNLKLLSWLFGVPAGVAASAAFRGVRVHHHLFPNHYRHRLCRFLQQKVGMWIRIWESRGNFFEKSFHWCKKNRAGRQDHVVTWTWPYPAQKFEDSVEMRGTTLNWCCIEQIVVSPSNFGFSNLVDN